MNDIHITVNGRSPRFCPFEACDVLLTHDHFKTCKRHRDHYVRAMQIADKIVALNAIRPFKGLGRFSPREMAIDFLMKAVNDGVGIVPPAMVAEWYAEDALRADLQKNGNFLPESLASDLLSRAGFPR